MDTRHAHCLDLDHPARTQSREDRVDLAGKLVSLEIRSAFGIRTGKIPPGHQTTVLQQENAVIDKASIRNEVRE
uniref:Uncharacterized protein n=1 Tax=Rhizobium leguminosarum TaxID=384 RepID=A0A179B9W5_RHILE|nr:hypothetical protein A4U53_35855 [Rhizobium leguminosarum]